MVFPDHFLLFLAGLPGVRRGIRWLWDQGPKGADIPNYRWVVMGLFSTCQTTGWMFPSTLGLLLPAISADLSLSPSQQGLLSSSAFWGNLALGIPISWWVSRYRPKTLTTVALALGALFFFVQGWAPVFAVLLAGRLFFGIAHLTAQPARALLTTQWFADREVVLATTFDNALFGLIVGVGFSATPFLLKSLGNDWRMTFNIFGAVFAAFTLLWMLLGRERVTAEYRRREVPREAGLVRGAVMHRDLWIAGLGFMGPAMATTAFISFFPTLMLDSYGVSLKWSGVLLGLTHLIGGASGLGFGYFVFVGGKRNHLLVVLGLLLAGTYMGMTLTGSLPLLLVLACINGIAWGYWPTLATVPYQLPGIRPREVAVANTLIFTMASAGFVLGPLIAGFLQEALGDLKLALILLSFTALFLTACGLFLRPPPLEALNALSRGKGTYSG
jgi:ACS family hexuronate transporter-like MFS transporter